MGEILAKALNVDKNLIGLSYLLARSPEKYSSEQKSILGRGFNQNHNRKEITKFDKELIYELSKNIDISLADQTHEAIRREFLNAKNQAYQVYKKDLKKLETQLSKAKQEGKTDRDKLKNAEKYALFVNEFFGNFKDISSLLPYKYNLERKAAKQFISYLIKTTERIKENINKEIAGDLVTDEDREEAALIRAEVINAPVGSGKTFLMGMLLAAMPDEFNALVSVGERDLMRDLLKVINYFIPEEEISHLSSNKHEYNVGLDFTNGDSEIKEIRYGLGTRMIFAVNNSLAKLASLSSEDKREREWLPSSVDNLHGITSKDFDEFLENTALVVVDEVHQINNRNKRINIKEGSWSKNVRDFMKRSITELGIYPWAFSVTPNNFTYVPTSIHDEVYLIPDAEGNLRSIFTSNPISELLDSEAKMVRNEFNMPTTEFLSVREETENLTEEEIKDLAAEAKMLFRIHRINYEIKDFDAQHKWKAASKLIAAKINNSHLKYLRGLSFVNYVEEANQLCQDFENLGINSANYSYKGVLIPKRLVEPIKSSIEGVKHCINGDPELELKGPSKYQGDFYLFHSRLYKEYNRDVLLKAHKKRALQNVVNLRKLATGVDLPYLEYVVLGHGPLSHTRAMQELRNTRVDLENMDKVPEVVVFNNFPMEMFIEATGLSDAQRCRVDLGGILNELENFDYEQDSEIMRAQYVDFSLLDPSKNYSYRTIKEIKLFFQTALLDEMKHLNKEDKLKISEYYSRNLKPILHKSSEQLAKQLNVPTSQLIKRDESGTLFYSDLLWFPVLKQLAKNFHESDYVNKIVDSEESFNQDFIRKKQYRSMARKITVSDFQKYFTEKYSIAKPYVLLALKQMGKIENINRVSDDTNISVTYSDEDKSCLEDEEILTVAKEVQGRVDDKYYFLEPREELNYKRFKIITSPGKIEKIDSLFIDKKKDSDLEAFKSMTVVSRQDGEKYRKFLTEYNLGDFSKFNEEKYIRLKDIALEIAKKQGLDADFMEDLKRLKFRTTRVKLYWQNLEIILEQMLKNKINDGIQKDLRLVNDYDHGIYRIPDSIRSFNNNKEKYRYQAIERGGYHKIKSKLNKAIQKLQTKSSKPDSQLAKNKKTRSKTRF